MIVSRTALALLAAALGTVVACGDKHEETSAPSWSCQDVQIPNGRTYECTSKVTSAVSIDSDGAVTDGPSYYCPLSVRDSDCPPVATDGVGAGGTGGAGGGTGAPPVSGDGTSANGAGTFGGTTGGAGGGGSANASSDGTASNGTGTAGTGGGRDPSGLDQPAIGSSTGSGSGAGTNGAGNPVGSYGTSAHGSRSGASISLDGDGFHCTKEAGIRTCRRAPRCFEGSHRVQMDCEPDQSSGLGVGSGEPGVGYSGAGSDATEIPGSQTQCFYPVGAPAGTTMPAATFEYVLEAITGVQQLHVRLTFAPTFVDNSYGAGSVGWAKGHKFAELVGSDHAELTFFDKGAVETLHFKMDYISQSASAPSGYACLGVNGGEGRMILGNASMITKAMSSLDRNLNERGYKQYTLDSPATDDTYTSPAAAPKWDYRVIYEAWIKNEAFGAGGFGSVKLAFVHASPSKANSNTLPVEPGPCPPSWTNGAIR